MNSPQEYSHRQRRGQLMGAITGKEVIKKLGQLM
jgi:hypothetical protein